MDDDLSDTDILSVTSYVRPSDRPPSSITRPTPPSKPVQELNEADQQFAFRIAAYQTDREVYKNKYAVWKRSVETPEETDIRKNKAREKAKLKDESGRTHQQKYHETYKKNREQKLAADPVAEALFLQKTRSQGRKKYHLNKTKRDAAYAAKVQAEADRIAILPTKVREVLLAKPVFPHKPKQGHAETVEQFSQRLAEHHAEVNRWQVAIRAWRKTYISIDRSLFDGSK